MFSLARLQLVVTSNFHLQFLTLPNNFIHFLHFVLRFNLNFLEVFRELGMFRVNLFQRLQKLIVRFIEFAIDLELLLLGLGLSYSPRQLHHLSAVGNILVEAAVGGAEPYSLPQLWSLVLTSRPQPTENRH
jgi:hypothetical protein